MGKEGIQVICVYCHLPIDGPSMGAGDGTGQKFAHPYCYYRKRCEVLEEDVEKLKLAASCKKDMVREYTSLKVKLKSAELKASYYEGLCVNLRIELDVYKEALGGSNDTKKRSE